MYIQELTYSEKVLLSSVAFGTIFLTALVILCIIWKKCWIHKFIWKDAKKKSGKALNDIICIRYPPDMYPSSVGVYRENILRSPEDELARLFSSPGKRDSTYSSMSETSSPSVYELANNPHSTSTPTPVTLTPESPDSTSHLITNSGLGSGGNQNQHHLQQPNNNNGQPIPMPSGNGDAEQHRFNEHQLHMIHSNNRQPFFTFALKYEDENGLIHVDFIEARNIPFREYLNQPCDVFFTLEIQPKKQSALSASIVGPKRDLIRYRFVTKTIRKATDTCDFSEKFLAQLSKANLKDYNIRFSAFDQDRHGNPTELGSTTLTFDDFRDFTHHKLILSCSLKEPVLKRGQLLLGLCYLPTAERMSVTIVKVTNLNPHFSLGAITKQSICYVRLLLLRADTGKVLKRKKTTYQKLTGSGGDEPTFNETLVFDMPPTELVQTVLLVLVCLTDKNPITSSPSTHGPSHSHLSTKRHSTPAQPFQLRSPQISSGLQRHRHSADEVLFHFSDNLTSGNGSGNGFNSMKNSSGIGISISGAINEPESECSSRRESVELPEHRLSRVKDHVVGKVAFGFAIKNPIGKNHWEKMIRAPRTVATEWHSLI